MSSIVGIPQAAMNSLIDLVDNCAEVKPGMDCLIIAQKDGLYGGDNCVDPEAVEWLSTVVQSRGANCSIMWFDNPVKVHEWTYPQVVKGAVDAADLVFNFSFDLVTTENPKLRKGVEDSKTWLIPMFPVTAPMLMTDWAQTPYELLVAIRHISSKPFMNNMAPFVMTDPNGTHIEGNVLDPVARPGIPGLPYDSYRKQVRHVAFWPEWLHPPVNCTNVNGVYKFDRMLAYWSRYIGIKPEWDDLVTVEVENSRIVNITGGEEAAKIMAFLKEMETKVGDGMWKFDTFHFGVHPNATIEEYQCPNDLRRRFVNHAHTSNVHAHLGSAPANDNYPFYPHITADIRRATLTVGGVQVYDDGYLCCLDDPSLQEIMKKYPGRPGIPPRTK